MRVEVPEARLLGCILHLQAPRKVFSSCCMLLYLIFRLIHLPIYSGVVNNSRFLFNHSGHKYLLFPLFVFQNDDSQQNVNYLLTPVFNSVFNALSHGALCFALHGSSNIHFLIGWNSSTANKQISIYWYQNWVYILLGVITLKNKQWEI